MDGEAGCLTAMGVFTAIAIALGVFVIAFDVIVLQPEEEAWRAACAASGGTPVPTTEHHDKMGTHYGDFICAKIDVLDVKK